MPQWTLKITRYADELADALDTMDGWPEQVRAMQRNWIGRSEGVDIDFTVEAPAARRRSRRSPSTLRAPIPSAHLRRRGPRSPPGEGRGGGRPGPRGLSRRAPEGTGGRSRSGHPGKLGLPTSFTARHPLTGAPLPIWVANFVLMDYGTRAVMAVPGHDERDFEFAQKYGLPIVQVVAPKADSEAAADLSQAAYTSKDGVLVNSPVLTDWPSRRPSMALRALSKGRARGVAG